MNNFILKPSPVFITFFFFILVIFPNPLLSQSLGLQPIANHFLGVHEDGTVYAWGWNNQGQLGDSSYTSRYTPLNVLKGEYNGTRYLGDNSTNRIIAVALGYEFSLALAEDGTVYSWGWNAYGQLGINSTTGWRLAPVKVKKGSYDGTEYLGDNPFNKIVAIACGYRHAIALAEDGSVYTWGLNTYGQLGNNSTALGPAPVKVVKGAYDGTAYLGDSAGNKILKVALGFYHSIAVAEDGTVYSWGYNIQGQLGNSSTIQSLTPVKVLKGGYNGTAYLGDDPGNKIISVSAAYAHSAALAQDGTVYTWGLNNYGQIGDNTFNNQRLTPVRVVKGAYNGIQYLGDDPANKIIAVVLGYYYSAALAIDGSVYTWGVNNRGQLGDDTFLNRLIPVRVLKGAYNGTQYLGDDVNNKIISIGIGYLHAGALAQDGHVYTWGCNDYGQLGDNSTIISKIPVIVHGVNNSGLLDLNLPQPEGTTLSASVSSTILYTREFAWTINKTAVPSEWNFFEGDTGITEYTVTLTKDEGTPKAVVSGGLCIINEGIIPTVNLSASVELMYGDPPNQLISSVNVDLSSNPILDPQELVCFPYEIEIPAETIYHGGTYSITANVTITNYSDHIGTPFGPTTYNTCILPVNPVLIKDVVNITDTYGGPWQFNSGGSVSYQKAFTCASAGITDYSTAEIIETGQAAITSVNVNRHYLSIMKEEETGFTRTYLWELSKTADQSDLVLSLGQVFIANYTVQLKDSSTDGSWGVNGKVVIKNPAPVSAVINSISDIISPDIPCSSNCVINFPYSLASGDSLVYIYDAGLPDAANRNSTAEIKLQNFKYDCYLNSVPCGVTNLLFEDQVVFTEPKNIVNECINLTDDYYSSFGTVCSGDTLKTFVYARELGPYQSCGNYTVSSTALIIETGASAVWLINIYVPCNSGCTLGYGYWKNHSEYGPAKYDDTWAKLLNGSNTIFFLSGKSYYQVLRTMPKENAYFILAHQYIAAELNMLNGADPTSVQQSFNTAKSLLNTYTPAQIAALLSSDNIRMQFIALARTLDDYNNGKTGPGYCDDDKFLLAKDDEEESLGSDYVSETFIVPTEYSISQNYPNPFNPNTIIHYQLPEAAYVVMKVYDVIGNEVDILVNGLKQAGFYEVNWNPAGLPSGIYFYRIQTGSYVDTKKMVLIR